VVQDQIDAGARRDRRQSFQKFVRCEDQVARAVMPRTPERAGDAAVGESCETLLRERQTLGFERRRL